NYIGLYFQDSYRMRPNLTINAGLRYDPYLPAVDRSHRGSHFDLNAFKAGIKSSVFPQAPAGLFYCGDPQTPCEYVNGKYGQFSTRIGRDGGPFGKGKTQVPGGLRVLPQNPETFFSRPFSRNLAVGQRGDPPQAGGRIPHPLPGTDDPAVPVAIPADRR